MPSCLFVRENTQWDKMSAKHNDSVKNDTDLFSAQFYSLDWLEIKDWSFRLNIEVQQCSTFGLIRIMSSYIM